MVGAAVPERKLEGLVSRPEREQLVPEADAEDRHAAEQLTDDGNLVCEWLGIARPVRQQHSVETDEFVRGRIVREDRDGGPRARKATEDRALAPVIDDRDSRAAGLGVHERSPLDRKSVV